MITRLKKVPEKIAERCKAFKINVEKPNDLNMTCYEFENVPKCLVFALKRIITMYTYSVAYDYDNIIIEKNKSNHFIDTIKHRVQFIKIEHEPIFAIDNLYIKESEQTKYKDIFSKFPKMQKYL